MSTAVRLGVTVALIVAACATTSTAPTTTTTTTVPTTTSTEPATTGTHRPDRGGVSESEVPDSVGADGGVSPNGGFVSLSASVSCAFRGDGSTECWRPLERPESPGWITIDGSQRSGKCGIRIDGTLQCWDGEDDHIGGPPEDPDLPYLEFPFPGRLFTALSGGHDLACAIDVEKALACTMAHGYPIDLGDYMPDGEFISVAAGSSTTCGVRVDATVGCVGGLEFDGEFVSVAVGYDHVCKVRVGGEVVCWYDGDGEHNYGKASPPDGSFSEIVVDRVSSCGLRVDGEVVCWGLRDSGPVWDKAGAGWNQDGGLWPRGPFTALDLGHEGEICALRVGGRVACWNNGSATHEPPGGRFVAVDAGPAATCGLRPDGEVECWGYDEKGSDSVVPLDWEPPAGPFTAVSVGDGYACALRGDGEATCWDRDDLPGEREIRRRLRPPAGPFTAISAGGNVTCALRGDGEAVCWGLYATQDEVSLAAPPPGPFVAIRAAWDQACALRPDGEAVCWNTGDGALSALDGSYRTLIGGVAAACGLRLSGELACADADHRLARHAPDITFRAVAAHGDLGCGSDFGGDITCAAHVVHACGLDFAGEITCWHSAESWHEPTPPGPFSAVTVGAEHTCALRPDGTAECWTPHWPPGAAPAATAPSPPS